MPDNTSTFATNLHFSPEICAKLKTLGLTIDPSASITGDLLYHSPAFFISGCQLHFVKIDAYSLTGHNSCFRSTSIGRYCSIAHKVEIGLFSPDLDGLSTSQALFSPNPFLSELKHLDPKVRAQGDFYPKVTIGHDVWIGTHVYIPKSVTIGTGAVIGAGSVITHDVPPYAVVAGSGGGHNSQGIIRRYRFSDEIIADLLESKWWEYDLPQVMMQWQQQGRKLPLNNVSDFLSLLRNEDTQSWPKISEQWMHLHPISDNKAELTPVGPDFELPQPLSAEICQDPAWA